MEAISHPRYRRLLASLPSNLARFCVSQDYSAYSDADQGTWQAVVLRLAAALRGAVHPAYSCGMAAVGLRSDRIPDIDELNIALQKFGWGAVVVEGFIPPAVFMEFQARRILPICADIRPPTQSDYTPAPDIVHEAAGHAPMLALAPYRRFLQRFGELGAVAASNDYDRTVYAATRRLSELKAPSSASARDIACAEDQLTAARVEQRRHEASPATLLSRLHWWTVEYGLIGDGLMYGAGLLSSLAEIHHARCVPLRRLSAGCIFDDYDITRLQPHLYVASDWGQLDDVLEEVAERLGLHALATRDSYRFEKNSITN